MVLEGATSADSSFSDTLPSSDRDPYANDNPPSTDAHDPQAALVTTQPGAYQRTVNLEGLPRRWSLIGEKPHPQALVKGIEDSCRFATTVLNREVTQDEADAFAFHFAKSMRVASYGTPIGNVLGAAMAYRTRKDMRFPGWSPFKEGSRFSKDSFGPFKGQLARNAWQSARISAYLIVGSTFGQIFFGSYALSVGMAGRAMDPRLTEFTQALKARMQNGVGRESTGKVGNQEAGPKGTESYDMARQRRDVQGKSRDRRQPQKHTGDDASPTGGAFSDDYMETAGASGFMSEEEVRREADTRQESPRNQGSAAFEQSAIASRQHTADAQVAPAKSGSSWDRLRKGAMTGEQNRSFKGSQPSESAGSRAPAQGGDNSSLGDSFSFSSNDEDRQLAKSEAQRDFDARIEREREGRNFDEKGGGKGKW
ncbi:hypothetical protein LTR36_004238 [Oleoguttula mirabilis]|uniref:Uncharacterized protein n=1 Tax=Oleoguttula mirabilis TaxID=1507867 RepID=A0AAV9JGM8_9PEZI|nr:hypothetical protein LTR36_004238 [Oleoguttula mirabilis]